MEQNRQSVLHSCQQRGCAVSVVQGSRVLHSQLARKQKHAPLLTPAPAATGYQRANCSTISRVRSAQTSSAGLRSLADSNINESLPLPTLLQASRLPPCAICARAHTI